MWNSRTAILILLFASSAIFQCSASWYYNSAFVKSKEYKDFTEIYFQDIKREDNLCLIGNIHFSQDPKEIRPDAVNPEFLKHLTGRLNAKGIKTSMQYQIYNIPEIWIKNKYFEPIKIEKSFNTISNLKKSEIKNESILKTLIAFFPYTNPNTQFLSALSNPYLNDKENCDLHMYFKKRNVENSSSNLMLFVFTLGAYPYSNSENHIYEISIRRKNSSEFETISFKFGYKNFFSWIFIPTFGLLDQVTSFESVNSFSQETEDSLLDSLEDLVERSI